VTMKITRASQRGHTNLGWLDSYHSFSFGGYYNPANMHFGMLRVLNHDRVEPGAGFGTHGHENMEIISIPLSGSMAHRDSLGSEQFLRPGDVQVMSAGSGITHSEYNGSATEGLEFLQIWIVPNVRSVKPRYEEAHIGWPFPLGVTTVVGPIGADAMLGIHQDATISTVRMEGGTSITIKVQAERGVHLFVIDGAATAGQNPLSAHDAVEIHGMQDLQVMTETEFTALLINVPLG